MKYNKHTHYEWVFLTETSKVLAVEKSYRHWNEWSMLPICFGCDGSKHSGQGQMDSLCRICVGFTQYFLFIQSCERGLFQTCDFTTNVYNALQIILVFLTEKRTIKRYLLFNMEYPRTQCDGNDHNANISPKTSLLKCLYNCGGSIKQVNI